MTENNNNTFKTLTQEHIREAERLKKAWFDHVLNSLEKLGKSIEKVSSELQTVKEDLYKEVTDVKELLHKEIKDCKGVSNVDIEKLEKRTEKALDGLVEQIKFLTADNVKEELMKEISDLKDKKIAPLENDVVSIKTKIGTWVLIISLGGVAIAEILIQWVLPFLVQIMSTGKPIP